MVCVAKMETEQEKFWAGEFGDRYATRNTGEQFVANQTAYFSRVLSLTHNVKSVIEYGANIGENLHAIKSLLPDVNMAAVEINASAADQISAWKEGKVDVYQDSILHFESKVKYDLTFVKGVLIHINPDKVSVVYDLLYQSSKRYILIGEYYNPSPVTINYRGNNDRLFKRDFCGEMMDKYPDLVLIDYGFCYHRDPNFPQDDITWFLLEKNSSGRL